MFSYYVVWYMYTCTFLVYDYLYILSIYLCLYVDLFILRFVAHYHFLPLSSPILLWLICYLARASFEVFSLMGKHRCQSLTSCISASIFPCDNGIMPWLITEFLSSSPFLSEVCRYYSANF